MKSGGRKKGTPNKKTRLLEDKVLELGIDPFEILCLFASGNIEKLKVQSIPLDLRFKAVREICQYLHPKRKAIDIAHKVEKSETIEQLIRNAEKSIP